jgi:hypothetical protein
MLVEATRPTREYWIAVNGCNEEETHEEVDPCVVYEGCDSDFPVQYCEHSGGHDWPDFASDAIWDFFKSLPPAVPSNETGSGDVEDLGKGEISFKILYPADFVGESYKLAVVLYPYNSSQPLAGNPSYIIYIINIR